MASVMQRVYSAANNLTVAVTFEMPHELNQIFQTLKKTLTKIDLWKCYDCPKAPSHKVTLLGDGTVKKNTSSKSIRPG
jgi:hypothetical protein